MWWNDWRERWLARLDNLIDPDDPRPPSAPGPGPLDEVPGVPYQLLQDLQSLIGRYQSPPALIPTARQSGSKVHVEVIGGSVSALGMILAALTIPAELDDPESLSRRITLGVSRGSWAYGIVAGRYLTPDRGICLKVTIEMPAEDVPEVVARLTADAR